MSCSPASGAWIGMVVDTNDPLGKHRVRVRIPTLEIEDWVRVVRAIGTSRDNYYNFRANQEVLVAFLQGDIERPIVIGGFWDGDP